MEIRSVLLLAAIMVGGCTDDTLPGGYTLKKSAMNREWLLDPDGLVMTPGLVKSLYRNGNQLVVVAHAASTGGEPIPPLPIDDTCFFALSIDTAEREVTQITVAEASKRASGMTEVVSTNRSCL